MAADIVQPVPWVCRVGILRERSVMNRFPS
jgi:hypothetical protein